MMSSSEIQRITLSAKKIVSPTGSIDLEEWEDDVVDEQKTEDGDENTTVEATTPISAANSDLAVNKRGKELAIYHLDNIHSTSLPFQASQTALRLRPTTTMRMKRLQVQSALSATLQSIQFATT